MFWSTSKDSEQIRAPVTRQGLTASFCFDSHCSSCLVFEMFPLALVWRTLALSCANIRESKSVSSIMVSLPTRGLMSVPGWFSITFLYSFARSSYLEMAPELVWYGFSLSGGPTADFSSSVGPFSTEVKFWLSHNWRKVCNCSCGPRLLRAESRGSSGIVRRGCLRRICGGEGPLPAVMWLFGSSRPTSFFFSWCSELALFATHRSVSTKSYLLLVGSFCSISDCLYESRFIWVLTLMLFDCWWGPVCSFLTALSSLRVTSGFKLDMPTACLGTKIS